MESQDFLRELNTQLTYLFSFAQKINEIDTAAALFGEFRGAQDANWSTVGTAHEVYQELRDLGSREEPLTRAELRQLLCLYAQLSEAGGVYEGLLNTLQVPQLKAYNLWPFQKLVRVRKQPRAIIGPNSNLMFRRLASAATEIGMTGLARLLELAFRDDIRNAMAHADYILVGGDLRLRKRNGGRPEVVPLSELLTALQIAIFFFALLHNFQESIAQSFRPARTVIGKFSENPPMPWKVGFSDDGSFSFSSSSPGPQVDAAYERQAQINDYLGGRVVASYLPPGSDFPAGVLEEIQKIGFEVLIVAMESVDQYETLVKKVEKQGLWDATAKVEKDDEAVLMITPLGFRWVSTGAGFQSWLPTVNEIEVA